MDTPQWVLPGRLSPDSVALSILGLTLSDQRTPASYVHIRFRSDVLKYSLSPPGSALLFDLDAHKLMFDSFKVTPFVPMTGCPHSLDTQIYIYETSRLWPAPKKVGKARIRLAELQAFDSDVERYGWTLPRAISLIELGPLTSLQIKRGLLPSDPSKSDSPFPSSQTI